MREQRGWGRKLEPHEDPSAIQAQLIEAFNEWHDARTSRPTEELDRLFTPRELAFLHGLEERQDPWRSAFSWIEHLGPKLSVRRSNVLYVLGDRLCATRNRDWRRQ